MKQKLIDYIKNYQRLTEPIGYCAELDLTQQMGYSHIYERLSELENIIEAIQKGKIQLTIGEKIQ